MERYKPAVVEGGEVVLRLERAWNESVKTGVRLNFCLALAGCERTQKIGGYRDELFAENREN